MRKLIYLILILILLIPCLCYAKTVWIGKTDVYVLGWCITPDTFTEFVMVHNKTNNTFRDLLVSDTLLIGDVRYRIDKISKEELILINRDNPDDKLIFQSKNDNTWEYKEVNRQGETNPQQTIVKKIDLTIHSFFSGSKGQLYAIVGDAPVEVGDRIHGAEILEIGRDFIKIKYKDKIWIRKSFEKLIPIEEEK